MMLSPYLYMLSVASVWFPKYWYAWLWGRYFNRVPLSIELVLGITISISMIYEHWTQQKERYGKLLENTRTCYRQAYGCKENYNGQIFLVKLVYCKIEVVRCRIRSPKKAKWFFSPRIGSGDKWVWVRSLFCMRSMRDQNMLSSACCGYVGMWLCW